MSDARPLGEGDHLYLIDGSGYIFRAYHALPPLTRKSDGLPVGAVSGFCNMLFRLLEETQGEGGPSHLAVIFDKSSNSFRNEIYPEYKAQRPDPPEDLRPQFPLIRDATRAFGQPCVEMEGFEADDLIATYARAAERAGARVTVISSDKDLMQLVSEQIEMLDPVKQKPIRRAEVIEKFGVGPEQVIEVQALAGDSVDNVPGAPGVGVKTAAKLLAEFGDLDQLLARAEEIKQPKRRQTLIDHADAVRLSRILVTLKDDVDAPEPLSAFGLKRPDPATLIGFLKAMEFTTLTKRVASALDADMDALAPDAAFTSDEAASAPEPGGAEGGELTPGAVPDGLDAPIDHGGYETVTDLQALQRWIAAAREAGVVAIDTETTSLDPTRAALVGISLALAPGRACYIPLGHTKPEGLDLEGEELAAQAPMEETLAALKPLLADPSVLKVGQNIKYDLAVFAQVGLALHPVDDTMLISYALDAGLHGHGMDTLSKEWLGHQPIPIKELIGSGKSAVTFDKVPVEKASAYAAEDADVTWRLWARLKPRLSSERRMGVYETLERPMPQVLADMECAGIKADLDLLRRLSNDFASEMGRIEAEIHELAGEAFNIASTKQLGSILFEKMGLQSTRKTAGGAASTHADVLEELAAQGHDLPAKVLDWRQLSKLKGTYADALQAHVNPKTGRVHTSYSLAATTTGRLSSNDPNLQNIPVRTPEGRKLRQAFIAEEGHSLVSADYSQIELRLLAHIADIPELRAAFARGEDIHARTASEMFGVPVKGMDPAIRRQAKAINFGIIYGMSAYGLANNLRIPQDEARTYINTYFERFPGIRDYMERTKKQAREDRYVETVFGRRCNYPDIGSKMAAKRGFMERAAINAPIQGSAADIIRRAMIRMPAALADAGLKARMLLQVHDELVFECPDDEVEALKALARRVMEEAPLPAVALSAPLTVDAGAGANWDEAH